MKKKIAVVTGGAGFIGSHLCDKLIKEGFRVLCLDNLITGNPRNVAHLFKDKNFRFIKHDVTKYITIREKVDYVLHFASPASPIDYLKFPIQTLKVGSLGTHNALGLAKLKRAKFLLASTSEVYGDPLIHPQPERYWGNVNPVGVRGCYDEAKRFAEAITMAYHRVHKLDARIVRIFNTYGERMRINDGRVIPNFIFQALHNKPLTVYGKGRQTRSFCYISDLVDGIYRLMSCSENEPVNLGNPSEFTIMELAKLILKLTPTKSKIVFRPLPIDDPKQRKPDISKAKMILKWQPKVALNDGITRTIDWFKGGFTPLEIRKLPVEKRFLTGFTLPEIMFVVAIIAILAAIAIPGLLRAKINANESNAQATLKTIASAIENYAAANIGNYPTAIADLTSSDPPYLNEDYTSSSRQGYNFACESMAAASYSCTAAPLACNISGSKTFTITTGGVLSWADCS